MSPEQSGHSLLHLLQQQLALAEHHNQTVRASNAQGNLIQVPDIGKTLTSGYEQLRNAAEYTEEHLLLQRAIRRFLIRNLSFASHKEVTSVGEELIVELTLAGYLQNNSFGSHVSSQLTGTAAQWMNVYWSLRQAEISKEQATEWILDILTVTVEETLNPHRHLNALATFAYNYYLSALPREQFIQQPGDAERYEFCLYLAVSKALLKSDIALVRHDLLLLYSQDPNNVQAFVAFNQQVDAQYVSVLTETIQRSVSKYGAPIRILKTMSEDYPALSSMLNNSDQFLATYEKTVDKEYKNLGKRLNKGIIKSIVFIFITKIIIGVGVEVPYDLLFVGSVAILPLAVNLMVPPLYMAGLKLGLKPPSQTNASALRTFIAGVLYPSEANPAPVLTVKTKTASALAKSLYVLLFFIPFVITLYLLTLLHFNVAQAVIFFIFLSTASFLGFRLSSMIRELELITKQQGLLSALRDFFYLPFIVVGQWLSKKYARVNVVAFVLDMAIEMPLKTMLKLVRQWTRFLNEKRDEIYR
jgi:hypothetical protein